jgi:hypothetical protein
MFRFAPKRSLIARLLRGLGPPPPSPRRHFSNSWCYGGENGVVRHSRRRAARD